MKFSQSSVLWIAILTWAMLGFFSVQSSAATFAPQNLQIDAGSPQPLSTGTLANQGVAKSKSLLKVLRDGGPLMIPIGVCSFILLVVVFERAISLRKGRIIPGPFVGRFLEQLREGELTRESALKLCDENESSVAKMFAAGVRKWGRPSVEIEQAILDAGERISNDLRKHIRMMNGISTVTPLLGLLGTVFGMMHSFDSIAGANPAMGDSKPLVAAGISVALITTAGGLTVAILALIAYFYFVSRVDQRIVELDELGMEVVNCVSAEAIAGSAIERRAESNRPRGGPNRQAA